MDEDIYEKLWKRIAPRDRADQPKRRECDGSIEKVAIRVDVLQFEPVVGRPNVNPPARRGDQGVERCDLQTVVGVFVGKDVDVAEDGDEGGD